jgi:hypothetical protein
VNDEPPDLEDLERLGQVDPPPPAVVDAARELLWSAVSAEMLITAVMPLVRGLRPTTPVYWGLWPASPNSVTA